MQLLAATDSSSGLKYIKNKQTIGTSEEAIVLGEVTSPGWGMIRNLDATNFVNIKTGLGGVIFAKVPPGKCCGPIYFGSGAQAPAAIADTAACKIEVLIAIQ